MPSSFNKMGFFVALFFLSLCNLSVVNAAFIPLAEMTDSSYRGLPDFDALRVQQREKGIEEAMWTIHTKEIMGAISRGERRIPLVLKKEKIDLNLWNAEDPKPFFSQFLHTTSIEYNLKGEVDGVKRYMSLDDNHHASSIRSIDSNGMIHCAGAASHHLEEGDVIIASEHGVDVHSSSSSSLGNFMRSPSIERNKGFRLLRRVTNVVHTLESEACKAYETEEIHPLEIFSDFSVSTEGKNPFQISQYSTDDSTATAASLTEKHRSLQASSSYITCTNPVFGGRPTVGSRGQSQWTYALTSSYACLDYTYNLGGSVNINYNVQSQSAARADITIGSGLSCKSCYAYFGAALSVNIQYSSTYGYGFSGRLGGGAGYNVDLSINNPTISSAKTFQLLPADPNGGSVFQIFPGLVIWVCGQGLKATVSGTGSAQGTASMSRGASTNAQIGIQYVKSQGWGFPTSYTVTSRSPAYSFSAFRVTSFGIRIDLVASFAVGLRAQVGVAVGTAGLNALFNFDLTPYIGYGTSNLNGKTNFGVSTLSRRRRSLRVTKEEVVAAENKFVVGDSVPISVSYSGFNPSEPITAFYALKRHDVATARTFSSYVPIFNQEFIVSSTGEGVFETSYMIPWLEDLFLHESVAKWVVEVHFSNNIQKVNESPNPFTISSTGGEGVFTSGEPSEGSTIATGKSIKLTWNPMMLRYFDNQSPSIGLGTDTISKHVGISLIGGTSENPAGGMGMPLALTVNSKGVASFVIPKNVTGIPRGTTKFHLQIRDAERDGVGASSTSSFGISGVNFPHNSGSSQQMRVPRRRPELEIPTTSVSSESNGRQLRDLACSGPYVFYGLTASAWFMQTDVTFTAFAGLVKTTLFSMAFNKNLGTVTLVPTVQVCV